MYILQSQFIRKKMSCDTLLLTKITIINPFISSSFYQILSPSPPSGPLSMEHSPLPPPYQNQKKNILCILLFDLMKKLSIYISLQKKETKKYSNKWLKIKWVNDN